MIKNHILNVISAHKKEFSYYHVKSLYLFGSVARDDDNVNSDIDILVDFDVPTTFDLYMNLKFFLEELLNKKVDLVTEAALRPELRKYVEQDLIRAA